MLSKNQKQKITKIFQDEPVDAIYLFGSQTGKQADHLSDYDFGVIFRENLGQSERFQLKLAYITALEAILGRDRVDVVDFEQVPLRYQYSIVSPQEELYMPNPQRAKTLEARTIKCYLDNRHYQHRTAKRQTELLAQEGFKHTP